MFFKMHLWALHAAHKCILHPQKKGGLEGSDKIIIFMFILHAYILVLEIILRTEKRGIKGEMTEEKTIYAVVDQ